MNGNWKWTAAVTGATALAGWLASPPLQSTAPGTAAARTESAQTAMQAAVVSDIEEQASRLATRLRPAAAAPVPGRNLFQFGARPVARRAAVLAVQPASAPVEPARVPFPFRLTGVATDVVDGVARYTAVLSGPQGVVLAQGGDMAAPDYRVVSVAEDGVELLRVSDGASERFTLRP